jgi:hypothetical protein
VSRVLLSAPSVIGVEIILGVRAEAREALGSEGEESAPVSCTWSLAGLLSAHSEIEVEIILDVRAEAGEALGSEGEESAGLLLPSTPARIVYMKHCFRSSSQGHRCPWLLRSCLCHKLLGALIEGISPNSPVSTLRECQAGKCEGSRRWFSPSLTSQCLSGGKICIPSDDKLGRIFASYRMIEPGRTAHERPCIAVEYHALRRYC